MLSGPEQLEWVDAFFKAFSQQDFEDILLYRLDDRVEQYAAANHPYRTALGRVITAYSQRDWEARLIEKAVEARPANAALLRLARNHKAAAAPNDSEVERIIRASGSFLDMDKWLNRAGKLQVCVCRIELPAQGGGVFYGTGFLIGPDLVMTNYHVVEPVVALEDGAGDYVGALAQASDVVCRFDYKVLANGMTSPGTAYSLAQQWRVALSPNAPDGQAPTVDQVDFAVIRLAQPAGSRPIGDQPAAPGEERGWIKLPPSTTKPSLAAHSPLFIIQHPSGEPLKLALDLDAILWLAPDRTRVRYATNTEPGSSGSPCFDQGWDLVAVHHSGDRKFTPEYNEGMPIDAILGYLERHGLMAGIV